MTNFAITARAFSMPNFERLTPLENHLVNAMEQALSAFLASVPGATTQKLDNYMTAPVSDVMSISVRFRVARRLTHAQLELITKEMMLRTMELQRRELADMVIGMTNSLGGGVRSLVGSEAENAATLRQGVLTRQHYRTRGLLGPATGSRS